jgi:hypothetical protein
MAKRGGIGVDKDEAEEDDKDEYRAPYLARQMLHVETRTPGGYAPLGFGKRARMRRLHHHKSHMKHTRSFTMVQAARESRVKLYI